MPTEPPTQPVQPVRLRVTRLRRNLRPLALNALPLLVALPAGLTATTGPFVPILLLWAVVGTFLALRQDREPHRDERELVVDGVAARLGHDEVAVGDVRSATWRRDVRLGPVVEMQLPWRRRWRLVVDSPESARAVLAALRRDPRHRRAVFHALSPVDAAPLLVRWTIVLIVGTLLPLAALAAWGLASAATGVVALAATAAFAAMHAPRRIEVGADAVVVRWLGTTRHVALADVRAVDTYVVHGRELLGAELTLRGGASLRLPIERSGDGPVETGRLLERIRDAQQLGGDEAPSAALTALARGTRSSLAWVTALRGLAAGAHGDHRTHAPSREAFLAVMRDARTPAVTRAAAAVVLGRIPDAEAAAVTDAATSSVDPALRMALARAADADATDEALAEALAVVEAAEGTRRARVRPG